MYPVPSHCWFGYQFILWLFIWFIHSVQISLLLICFLFRITLVSSIFLIVGTAVERYLAVCRPHHYHQVRLKLLFIIISYYLEKHWSTIYHVYFRSRTGPIDHWPTSCPVWHPLFWSISQGEQNLHTVMGESPGFYIRAVYIQMPQSQKG